MFCRRKNSDLRMTIRNRYVSATKVLLSATESVSALRIERSHDGVVVSMVALSDLQMESAATIYYSGVITPFISADFLVGDDLRALIETKLDVGYDKPLLLWQNISLTDFRIGDGTTVRIL